MIEYIIEEISPDKAKTYLSTSKGNRNLRPKSVSIYARDMAAGRFQCTHQAIAFDESGALVDGHHRLSAIVKANVTVKMMVARNVPRKAIECIDTGDKRNTVDAIAFSEKFGTSPALRNKGTVAALCNMVRFGYNGDWKLSNAEKMALIEHFKDPLEALYSAAISRSTSSLAVVRGAALAAMLCGTSYEEIYDFFSVYLNNDTSQCADKNYTVILNLRRQIDNAKIKRVRIMPGKLYSMTQNAIWNFCASTTARTVKATDELRYPVYDVLDEFFKTYKAGV